MSSIAEATLIPTTITRNCYILYSTQTGRAKACARRVARIISERQQQQLFHNTTSTRIQLRNGNGNTFDDEIFQQQHPLQQQVTDCNPLMSISAKATTMSNPIVDYVKYLKHYKQQDSVAASSSSSLSSSVLILFVSTTGDGEHTDTIQRTWKLILQKSLSTTTFSGISFYIFCLGDRSYGEQFCISGRKVATRLIQLGATLCGTIGYGDDMTPNGGIFHDLDIWIDSILLPTLFSNNNTNAITNNHGIVDTTTITSSIEQQKQQVELVVRPPYKVTFVVQSSLEKSNDSYTDNIPNKNDGSCNSKVLQTITTIKLENALGKENDQDCSNHQSFLYSNSMKEFYAMIRPLNSYMYRITTSITNGAETTQLSSINGGRIPTTATIKRIHCQSDSNQTVSDNDLLLPLVGQVVVSKRITAMDWEQDTRHLRINLTTTPSLSSSSLEVTASSYDIASSSLTSESDPITITKQGRNGNIKTNNESMTMYSSSPPKNDTNDSTIIPSLPYQAGDVASILPCNSIQDVQRLIHVLPKHIQDHVDTLIQIQFVQNNSTVGGDHDDNNNYNSSHVHSFYPGVCYPYWPKQCTVRFVLYYCANILALPEREDLRTLSYYCSLQHPMGLEQSKKLKSLSEPSSSRLYVDYIVREKRTWIDVLYDFDSIQHSTTFTIEVLLALLQPLRPREYSIASSPTAEAVRATSTTTTCFPVEFCVAIVQGMTPLGRSYHGLCTRYLAHVLPPQSAVLAAEGTQIDISGAGTHPYTLPTQDIRMWIRPGSFTNLPLDVATTTTTSQTFNGYSDKYLFRNPVLCIGAGTGIAPLRSLLHEREAIIQQQQLQRSDKNGDSSTVAAAAAATNQRTTATLTEQVDNILLYGSRKRRKDFYYEKEWEHYIQSNRLLLFTAFSRDDNGEKDDSDTDETDNDQHQQKQNLSKKLYVQHVLRNMIMTASTGTVSSSASSTTVLLPSTTSMSSSSSLSVSSFDLYKFLIHQNGYIYIAGNPDMARAVKETIIDMLDQNMKLNNNDNDDDTKQRKSKEYIAKLARIGRLVIEAWS